MASNLDTVPICPLGCI